MTDAQTAAVAAPTAAYRWRWAALFVILAGEVMDLLDALVTIIAGPSILRDLGGGETVIQWLSAGYTMAMAAGLLVGGRLGDIYGKRTMSIVGAAGFTIFSLLAAVAQDPATLITARVLQGLLGAMMLPQGLGLIKEMFPPDQMAKAFGTFGPVMGLSAVGGPILAGWLVDADFFGWGWRMIFAINLPLGILAVVGALRYLPRSQRHASGLDLPGAALAAAAAVLLIYPLVQGREHGWPAWTFAMLALGLVAFAAFGWYEARRDRSGREPLVTPSLFRKRSFAGGMVAGLAFFSAMMGVSLVFTLFAQVGLGFSPLKAGLAAMPQAIGTVIGFVVANAGLQQRLGRGLLQLGTAGMALGLGALALSIRAEGLDSTIWSMAPAMAILGIGLGLALSPFFDIILAGVEPHETGSAAGAMTSVQQLGGALGIAILGTIFFSVVDGRAPAHGQLAFVSAVQVAAWSGVAMLIVTLALTMLLPKRARDEAEHES